MGNYSFKQVFTQEPAQIKSAVYAVGAALIVAGVIHCDVVTLASIVAPTEIILNLFYVRPLTVTKSAMQELSDGLAAGAAGAGQSTVPVGTSGTPTDVPGASE